MSKYHKLNLAILLTILLINISTTLHINPTPQQFHTQSTSTSTTKQQQQLNYLISLQNNYAQGISTLTTQTKLLRQKINSTTNLDDKIKLLQSAITKQRSKINTLTNSILPDPTLGYNQCQLLTKQQYNKIKSDLIQYQTRVNQLQDLIRLIPDCDQIIGIKQEINKLKAYINPTYKLLENKCQQNIIKANTVYQTNLYNNNNWLLGNMTMQQLINQFYQRSLDYNNISNCPLDRPFLSSNIPTNTQNSCIKCPYDKPYFDMSTKACTSCPNLQTIDINTHKCGYPLKNSNYTAGYNYKLSPLNALPTPLYNMICPPQTPFFNGTICVKCQPTNLYYWSVSQSICKKCQNYTYFNRTTKNCEYNPSIYVYGSKDRLLATPKKSIQDYNNTLNDVIKNNPTLYPATCPDITPYAAISSCVQCDVNNGYYFNVQTLNCTFCDGVPDPVTAQCAQKKYYFINTNANNIIVPLNTTLQQISSQNNKIIQQNPIKYGICPLSDPFPYNNKLSCGKCPQNAPLYNIQLQGCTFCSANQKFDPILHKCRNIIYLTNYDKNIIITPPNTTQSIIKQQININNTNANFTQKCPQNNPYTPDNIICMNCFNVAPYFNISSGLCVSCPYPTLYITARKGCYNITYLTNLSSPRLLQVQNYTIDNMRILQNNIKANNNITYQDCPINAPYGINSMCINCNDSNTVFNLKTNVCQTCPINTVYVQSSRKCVGINNITNVDAGLAHMIQDSTNTISNYNNSVVKLKNSGPYNICPASAPYVINGSCTACIQATPFFIIATQNCAACNNFQSNNNTCPPKPSRYPNLTNYLWITNDGNADKVITNGYKLKASANGPICPSFYNENTKQCVNCQQNYYYNYDNNNCQRCPSGTIFDINIHTCTTPYPAGTYFTNLQASPNNLQIFGGLTLDQIKTTQQSTKSQYPNSNYCPTDKPFYDNIQCVICPSYKKYFNLRYKLCQVCLSNQKLVGNDCINLQGNKVWQEPIAQNVYPFLFANL